jgi:hypothetical protein
MADRAAACCCGALSLRIAGEPLMNAVCHCANCQRRTGSAFGWSCYFREDQVVGPAAAHGVYAFDSASGRAERHFCDRCGSTVFWRAEAAAGLIGVAGGCLSGEDIGEPTVSASEASRRAWVAVPESWLHAP